MESGAAQVGKASTALKKPVGDIRITCSRKRNRHLATHVNLFTNVGASVQLKQVVEATLQVINYCHITWLRLYAKENFVSAATKANV